MLFKSPGDIFRALDGRIIGNSELKKHLAMILFLQMRAMGRGASNGSPVPRPHTLVIGPPASGKSELMRAIAELVHPIPVLVEQVTGMSMSGYTGRNVDEIRSQLAHMARTNRAAPFAIVVLDGIEAAASNGMVDLDITGTKVQDALLKLIRDTAGEPALANVLFIGVGAFEGDGNGRPGLDVRVFRRIGEVPSISEPVADPRISELMRHPDEANQIARLMRLARKSDFIAYGMSGPLMDCFASVQVMEPLSPSQMPLLFGLPTGPLGRYRTYFADLGATLVVTAEARWELARIAEQSGGGAQGIQAALRCFDDLLYELPSKTESTAVEIQATAAFVRGEAEAKIKDLTSKRRESGGRALLIRHAEKIGLSDLTAPGRYVWRNLLIKHAKSPKPLVDVLRSLLLQKIPLESYMRAFGSAASMNLTVAYHAALAQHLRDQDGSEQQWESAREAYRTFDRSQPELEFDDLPSDLDEEPDEEFDPFEHLTDDPSAC